MALTDVSEVLNHKRYDKKIRDLDERVTDLEEGGVLEGGIKFGYARCLVADIRNLTTDSDGCVYAPLIMEEMTVHDANTGALLNLAEISIQHKFEPIISVGVQIGAKNDLTNQIEEVQIMDGQNANPFLYWKFRRGNGTPCANMTMMPSGDLPTVDDDTVLQNYVVSGLSSMSATISQYFLYRDVESGE